MRIQQTVQTKELTMMQRRILENPQRTQQRNRRLQSLLALIRKNRRRSLENMVHRPQRKAKVANPALTLTVV